MRSGGHAIQSLPNPRRHQGQRHPVRGFAQCNTVAPAQQVAYGAQCAERLRIALSNRARDEQLYRQAHFDSLTGFAESAAVRDRLSQELASTADGSQRGALLYVDLDHFKKVNDSVGHSAGDQLLTIRRATAALLCQRMATRWRAWAGMSSSSFCAISPRSIPPLRSPSASSRRCSGREHRRTRSLRACQHRHHPVPGRRQYPSNNSCATPTWRCIRPRTAGRSRAVFF